MMGLDYKDEATSFIEHYASEKPKAEWNPETSLFFLFFGVNDIIVPRFRGEEAGPDISKIFDSFHNTTMRVSRTAFSNLWILKLTRSPAL